MEKHCNAFSISKILMAGRDLFAGKGYGCKYSISHAHCASKMSHYLRTCCSFESSDDLIQYIVEMEV